VRLVQDGTDLLVSPTKFEGLKRKLKPGTKITLSFRGDLHKRLIKADIGGEDDGTGIFRAALDTDNGGNPDCCTGTERFKFTPDTPLELEKAVDNLLIEWSWGAVSTGVCCILLWILTITHDRLTPNPFLFSFTAFGNLFGAGLTLSWIGESVSAAFVIGETSTAVWTSLAHSGRVREHGIFQYSLMLLPPHMCSAGSSRLSFSLKIPELSNTRV
jgi:hypothetical protein